MKGYRMTTAVLCTHRSPNVIRAPQSASHFVFKDSLYYLFFQKAAAQMLGLISIHQLLYCY